MSSYNHRKLLYECIVPTDWTIKALRQCCVEKGEYGLNAPAVDYSPNLPAYIRITDIDEDGNFSLLNRKSVNHPDAEHFVLKKGDVLFARTGATVGKCYLHEQENGHLVYAGFLIRFQTDESILVPYFLKAYTSTAVYWNWVKRISARSGQPGINAEEYALLKVPIPPLPEQIAITNFLSLIEKAIRYQKRLVACKEQHKKWLMQQLLPGKKRLAGFEGKWKEYKISDLFQLTDRYIAWDDADLYNLVSIRRRFGGLFFRGDLLGEAISVKCLKEIHENDFLISKRQVAHGAWAVVPKEFNGGKVSDEYECLTIKDSQKLSSGFWAWYCQQPIMRHFAFLDSNGVHIEKLIFDFDQFKKRRVLLPPTIEEQTAIASLLQAADREIRLLRTKAEKLKEQKKWLVQVLLTGKKRLKTNQGEEKGRIVSNQQIV